MSLAVTLAACSHDKKQIVNEALASGDPRTQVLGVGAFVDTSWPSFGFYDKSGSFEHQYGGPEAGFFSYSFSLEAQAFQSVQVRARVSAESSEVGGPEETSDVTLSIDETELGTQTVRPDDSRGEVYTWQSSDPVLIQKLGKGGSYLLKFEVKPTAKNRRGICLYGESLDGKEAATPPTIELMRDAS